MLSDDGGEWEIWRKREPAPKRPKPPRPAPVPQVTIQARGSLGLNAAAYAALGQPERVAFATRKDGRAFAIRAARAEDEATYKVAKIAAGESYLVSAHALLRYVGWPIGTPARPVTRVEGDRLVVELPGEGQGTHG